MALQIGTTTDQVAKLGVFFARQGRSASEAMELTRVAALAAKVASIDAAESANYLTSAINGFGLAIDQAMAISDKFAALGASSASSYQEMAVALSKVAPSAKVAGVNIDQMLGFLAKGIETTREAPENIGTAFKTVFARMTQLRDFGKTLEEGVAVNTVEEALRTAGVALRDNQGNFRQMGDVLTELGYKFEGLSRNQQAYIATALAGTRQQSRLLAVLQSFDRTMELVETSTEAAGATLAQHAEYSGGMEAANARLQTSFQQIITSLVDSDAVI
jgi:TP901 family phage tail tape measure protein